MQTINVKQKGNTNERNLARIFTAWASEDDGMYKNIQFKRTFGSGAMKWQNVMVAGDIMVNCIEAIQTFPFCIETKHLKRGVFTTYKGTNNLRLNNGLVKIFNTQAKTEAESIGKTPLFIVKLNRKPYRLICELDLPIEKLFICKLKQHVYVYSLQDLINSLTLTKFTEYAKHTTPTPIRKLSYF